MDLLGHGFFLTSGHAGGAIKGAAKRGELIYTTGQTSRPLAKITATLNNSDQAMDASLMPCINCHGLDGKGILEGGVVPSDITWKTLTKPYTVTLRNKRKRRPYTKDQFYRAVTTGIDPSGNTLSSAMPRFNITQKDAADLIAYLSVINRRADRGISGNKITIGTYFPGKSQNGGIEWDLDLLTKKFYQSKRTIYNKQIQLLELTPHNLKQNINRVFAIVGSGAALYHNKQENIVNNNRVPFFSLLDHTDAQAPYIFQFLPGIPVQIRSLLDFVGKDDNIEQRQLFILTGNHKPLTEMSAGIEKFAKQYNWRKVTVIPIHQAYANLVRGSTLLYLANGKEIRQHIKKIRPGTKTQILIAAPILQGQMQIADFSRLKSRNLIAMPMAPVRRQSAAMQNFIRFLKTSRLDSRHLASKISAYVGNQFLMHSLVQTGQHITQAKFLAQLDQTKEYVSGLLPPIRYNPDRRLGINGALIFQIPGNMYFHELE